MLLGHEKFQTEAQQSAITEFVVRNIKADTTPAPAPSAEVEVEVQLDKEPVEA